MMMNCFIAFFNDGTAGDLIPSTTIVTSPHHLNPKYAMCSHSQKKISIKLKF